MCGTAILKITQITNGKVYGTFSERISVDDGACIADFSNGVSINNDDTFIVTGEEDYRAYYEDESQRRRATSKIKFQLGIIDGRPIVKRIEWTGGIAGVDHEANDVYYKVLN